MPSFEEIPIGWIMGKGADTYRKGFEGHFGNALVPGGSDATDGENNPNAAGNQMGSWVMREFRLMSWALHAYLDHFFEDHSQMFLLDYNGYGEGDEWNQKKKSRFFRYALKDMLWGMELNLKKLQMVEKCRIRIYYLHQVSKRSV